MNSNTQHGRQVPPQPAAPPTDPRTDPRLNPRTRNPPTVSPSTSGDLEICRDFIWGNCTLGAQCIHRHELEYEEMKTVLKFCHDHQNRTGCMRQDCTYLHTSREEQIQFLTAGQIPKVLIERYSRATTAPVAPAISENVQNGPPAVMYEYVVQPPPPPPPPPPATTGTTGPMQASMMIMQGPMQGPMQNPMINPMQGLRQNPMQNGIQGPMQNAMHGPLPNGMQGPRHGPMPGPLQGPMPGPMQGPMPGPMQGPLTVPAPMPLMPAPMPTLVPPPPPPPPPKSMVSPMRKAGPSYSAPMPQAQQTHSLAAFQPPPSQQPVLPPMFDPSRPPPPITQATRGIKRPAEDCEVGQCQLRKTESSNDSSCENCVQLLLRTEFYKLEIQKIHQENELAAAEVAGKSQEYRRKMQLMKAVLSPNAYRRAVDYVENLEPAATTNSSVVHQLAEIIVENSSRGLLDYMPSFTAAEDTSTRLHTLTTLLDLLENVPSKRTANGLSEADLNGSASSMTMPSSSNGFGRFLSDNPSPPAGGRARPYSDGLTTARPFPDVGSVPANVMTARSYSDGPACPAPGTLPYMDNAGPVVNRTYMENPGPANPHPYAEHRPAAPHPLTAPNAGTNAAPPYKGGVYATPTQPPNIRPYGQFPNNVANPPYPGVVPNQPRPPMLPQNAPNNPYFMGGRYPNQHYYPPYQ